VEPVGGGVREDDITGADGHSDCGVNETRSWDWVHMTSVYQRYLSVCVSEWVSECLCALPCMCVCVCVFWTVFVFLWTFVIKELRMYKAGLSLSFSQTHTHTHTHTPVRFLSLIRLQSSEVKAFQKVMWSEHLVSISHFCVLETQRPYVYTSMEPLCVCVCVCVCVYKGPRVYTKGNNYNDIVKSL